MTIDRNKNRQRKCTSLALSNCFQTFFLVQQAFELNLMWNFIIKMGRKLFLCVLLPKTSHQGPPLWTWTIWPKVPEAHSSGGNFQMTWKFFFLLLFFPSRFFFVEDCGSSSKVSLWRIRWQTGLCLCPRMDLTSKTSWESEFSPIYTYCF